MSSDRQQTSSDRQQNPETDTSYHGIKWVTGLSWEQVLTKAKTENKFIFVDCYATWCGPCKVMDKDVYPNDTVGDLP